MPEKRDIYQDNKPEMSSLTYAPILKSFCDIFIEINLAEHMEMSRFARRRGISIQKLQKNLRSLGEFYFNTITFPSMCQKGISLTNSA